MRFPRTLLLLVAIAVVPGARAGARVIRMQPVHKPRCPPPTPPPSSTCGSAGRLHGAPSASAYLKAGDDAVSRSEWTQAIRHYSAALEVWGCGAALKKQFVSEEGHSQTVLGCQIMQVDPNAAPARRKRAKAHAGMGDFKAALRDLGAALELGPKSIAVHLERFALGSPLCFQIRQGLCLRAQHDCECATAIPLFNGHD